MARKQYEFKPDRTGNANFSKLYLTKKQRQTLLKWLLYALFCLVLLVLQDVVMSRVSILGATTDLVCAAILIICILQGPETGGIFALITSMIYQFSGSSPGEYAIALLTVLGVLAATFRQAYLRKGFWATVVCAIIVLMLYEMGIFLLGCATGRTYFGRAMVFLLTGGITAATIPLMYPILLSIGKIGGETWKE